MRNDQKQLKLHKYQEEGIRLMGAQKYSLLADEPGLGKTLQALFTVKNMGPKIVKTVIVCPAIVKTMWSHEIKRVFGEGAKVATISTSKEFNSLDFNTIDVIILSYKMIIRPKLADRLDLFAPEALILDESHFLKNPKAKVTKTIFGKKSFIKNAKKIICLTGTPILSGPIDLYPMLKVLAGNLIAPYDTYEKFGKKFCKGYKSAFGWDFSGASNIEELQEKLRGFLIRRTREEVQIELPDIVESWIDLELEEQDIASSKIYEIASERRELGNDKLKKVEEYVKYASKNEKILVFGCHRDFLNALHTRFSDASVLLYGSMTPSQKTEAIESFINDPKKIIMFANTITAGTGLDGLQHACNRIIFAEMEWTPAVLEQAISRLRRIGQKSTVFVDYLIANEEIQNLDKYMIKIIQKKKKIIDDVLINTHINNVISFSREEINNMSIDALIREIVKDELKNQLALQNEQEEIQLNLFNQAQEQLQEDQIEQDIEILEMASKKKREPKPKVEKDISKPLSQVSEKTAMPKQEEQAFTLEDCREACNTFVAQAKDKKQAVDLIKNLVFPVYKISHVEELDSNLYTSFINTVRSQAC